MNEFTGTGRVDFCLNLHEHEPPLHFKAPLITFPYLIVGVDMPCLVNSSEASLPELLDELIVLDLKTKRKKTSCFSKTPDKEYVHNLFKNTYFSISYHLK